MNGSARSPGNTVWAEIDLDALAHNVRVLAERAAPARLYAIVKANAYGHGAVPVAATAIAAGAAGLGVARVDEGEELRNAGIDAPILVVGFTCASEAERIVDLRLTPTVCTTQCALALSRFAAARGVRQAIHVELESGLNRYGLRPDELLQFAESARELPGIEIEGIFTHFAAAEEGDTEFTRRQYDTLIETAARLPWIPMKHCSATASLLQMQGWSLDIVRAGLGLYGYYPAPRGSGGIELRRVLTLKSRVARVTDVPPGGTVGYGRTWTAEQESTIALVICGYADGLRRGLSNRAEVLIHGRRAPVRGRIAMDMCMVDVTGIEGVAVDDDVTIIGQDGSECVDADELAALADTISWEILAGISARVPRVYLRGGTIIGETTLTRRDLRWIHPAAMQR